MDRVKKLPIYLREKVDHVWLIDPVLKTLEVFQRSENKWMLFGSFAGNQAVQAPPFDAVEIDLGALWMPE